LRLCIRILINWNTSKSQKEIVHIYINDAQQLRPDMCHVPPVDLEELERWIAQYMETHEG
jgi:chorismate mutase